jgi:3-deoxy-D-manno-octulosonic-acid transferase
MLRLYNTVLLPIRVGVALWAACRPGRALRRDEWAERRARRLPAIPPHGVWIHGASVGEARIVRSLVESLRSRRSDLPLAVSAYTASGRAQLPEPPLADAAFFIPLDFPGLATRLLDTLQPAALTLVETELWPNLLHESHTREVPVVVLNGRLSSSRMARYRRLSRLFRPLVEGIAAVGAQTEADAERFLQLGVPARAVSVTGNIKYDLPRPTVDAQSLRERIGLPGGRALVVAGSTAAGEEALVLEAFEAARLRHGDLLLVLAPRHLSRVDEVDSLARSRGLRTHRYSAGKPTDGTPDVLLVDTLGDLAALYQLGQVAFVGGSLVPIGGHNLLEPVAVGVPLLFGPHTENVDQLAHILEQAGAARRVGDAAGLGRELCRLLDDAAARTEMSRRASEVLAANRGALERSVSLLLAVVDGR